MIDAFRRKGGKISDGVGRVSKKKEGAAELFEELEGEASLRQGYGGSPPLGAARGSEGKIPKRLVLVVVVGILVVGGLVLVLLLTNRTDTTNVTNSSNWQAVFLVNGQTYFGHVDGVEDGFLMMRDIYYLTNKTNVTNETNDGEKAPLRQGYGGSPLRSETKLVKFGTERHRPVDELKINMAQVLMIEELSKESEVVKAIEGYEGQD